MLQLHFYSQVDVQDMLLLGCSDLANKNTECTLADVALLVRASSCNQKVASSIPGQGTYLGCEFDPWSRHSVFHPSPDVHNPQSGLHSPVCAPIPHPAVCRRQPTDASLLNQCFSFSLSLPFSLRAMKKMSSIKDKKRKFKYRIPS